LMSFLSFRETAVQRTILRTATGLGGMRKVPALPSLSCAHGPPVWSITR
jgi:hypothetical protein